MLNFASMAPVPFAKAIWMIHSGKARPVGDKGIELLFKGLDAAIARDKGPATSHSAAGRVTLTVSEWDGNDPFEGCSAVMLRGNVSAPASYY